MVIWLLWNLIQICTRFNWLIVQKKILAETTIHWYVLIFHWYIPLCVSCILNVFLLLLCWILAHQMAQWFHHCVCFNLPACLPVCLFLTFLREQHISFFWCFTCSGPKMRFLMSFEKYFYYVFFGINQKESRYSILIYLCLKKFSLSNYSRKCSQANQNEELRD